MPDETVDLSARVDSLERRVARVETMTEVVTAVRAQVPTIADGVDPTLAQHVSSPTRSRITGCCWPGCSTTRSCPSWPPAAPRPRVGGRLRVRG